MDLANNAAHQARLQAESKAKVAAITAQFDQQKVDNAATHAAKLRAIEANAAVINAGATEDVSELELPSSITQLHAWLLLYTLTFRHEYGISIHMEGNSG
jgi:hypothetical protein